MLMIFCLRVTTPFSFNSSYNYWAQNLTFATWVLFIIFWVLRFSLLVWVLCSDIINIHFTSSLGLVCYLVNLLILLSLHPKLPYCQTLCFSDATCSCQIISALQYLIFTIQIFAMLLTTSVSLCMLLHILIGLLLSAYCVILRVRQHIDYILLVVLHLHSMAL
jgi:hypothetical protein